MKAQFFTSAADFRKWLHQHHATATELLVGYYKTSTKKVSMSWPDSVDQALCYGWIDGVRKSIDEESYSIRFTPRKKNSIWSLINIKKVEQLEQAGFMTDAGRTAFSHRKPEKTGIYSFEKKDTELPQEWLTTFMKNKKAWQYFQSLAPSMQRACIHWVCSAKQEKTRVKRFEELMECSRQNRLIKSLSY